MKPEKVFVSIVVATMIIGAATGVTGWILDSRVVKSAAIVCICLGLAISFTPLVGIGINVPYELIRKRDPSVFVVVTSIPCVVVAIAAGLAGLILRTKVPLMMSAVCLILGLGTAFLPLLVDGLAALNNRVRKLRGR